MLTAGTILGGRYRLDDRIAGGGMGDVWRGTDEVLGRIVAVKVLLPALLEEPGFAERFRGEARTMATINHPGVVDIYDYGNENGTAFLIMEYIEGDALSRTLSRVGRLTPGRTMALIAQAADALHAAHEKGIVHRDVKPGNLLVRPNGTLVLTDFGIARSAMVAQLTAAGSVLGTASYISPEQASGQGATPLSDVYALGIVAYQCLAGRRPFEGENPLEIAMRHVRDTPPPLPPDIPPPVRHLVETAMAKDPAARFPSAAALGHIARRVAGQVSSGTTATRPPVSHTGAVGATATGLPGPAPGAFGSPVAASAGPVSGGPVSGPSGQPVSGGSGYPVSGVPATPAASGPTSGAGSQGGYQPGPTSGAGSQGYQPGPTSGAGSQGGYQPGPTSGAGSQGYQPGPTSGAGSQGGYQPGPTSGAGSQGYQTGPTSGPPPGGPPAVAAGGTRIMPSGPATGPTMPATGAPPGPGQFARGAAGVPPPPARASDTGYTYVGTGPVQPTAPRQAAPSPLSNVLSGANRRTGLILAGAAAGAVVLLVIVVVGVVLLKGSGDKKEPDSKTGNTASAAATGSVTPIDCKRMPGNTFSSVKRALEGKGFKVKEVPVDQGNVAGDVVSVPCSAPAGSEVEVQVSTGKGQPAGGNTNPNPSPSCSGFIGNILPGGRNSCPPATAR